MKYAIVKSANKEIKIFDGAIIELPGIIAKPAFEVIYYTNGKKVFTQGDELTGVKVDYKVLPKSVTKKTDVRRFKSKSRYHKSSGSKNIYTRVLIAEVGLLEDLPVKDQHNEKPKKQDKGSVTTPDTKKAPAKKKTTAKKTEGTKKLVKDKK